MASPRREPHGISPAPGRVQAVSVGSTLTLLVHGRLDDVAGAQLLDAVAAGLVPGIVRLDVDLRDVDGFTDDGAAALVRVRDLGSALADGVRYRSAAGAGGDAFLSAFATPDPD
jgi:hypothetical protein